MRGLAKEVASRIPQEGPKPRILSSLPQKGLQPRTTRYLHHHIVLNYHFYLADENILNLGPDTKVLLKKPELLYIGNNKPKKEQPESRA